MIFIASDHAGNVLKEKIKIFLSERKLDFYDYSPELPRAGDDYTDYAFLVAEAVAKEEDSFGVLVCDTGIGMSIAANKVTGAYASLVNDELSAIRAREHNNANIIVLGSHTTDEKKALDYLDKFLKAEFSNEERHARRTGKIIDYEKNRRP